MSIGQLEQSGAARIESIRRSEEREMRGPEREAYRLAGFYDAQIENDELIERCKPIIELGRLMVNTEAIRYTEYNPRTDSQTTYSTDPGGYIHIGFMDYTSPDVILQKPKSDNEPWIIGRVSNNSWGAEEKVKINLASVGSRAAEASIRYAFSYYGGYEGLKSHVYDESEIFTYPATRYFESGVSYRPIVQIGEQLSSQHRISPLKDIKRSAESCRIWATIEECKQAIEQFESAIGNPELNPHLVDALQRLHHPESK